MPNGSCSNSSSRSTTTPFHVFLDLPVRAPSNCHVAAQDVLNEDVLYLPIVLFRIFAPPSHSDVAAVHSSLYRSSALHCSAPRLFGRSSLFAVRLFGRFFAVRCSVLHCSAPRLFGRSSLFGSSGGPFTVRLFGSSGGLHCSLFGSSGGSSLFAVRLFGRFFAVRCSVLRC